VTGAKGKEKVEKKKEIEKVEEARATFQKAAAAGFSWETLK
jgi:hypothetical protein